MAFRYIWYDSLEYFLRLNGSESCNLKYSSLVHVACVCVRKLHVTDCVYVHVTGKL